MTNMLATLMISVSLAPTMTRQTAPPLKVSDAWVRAVAANEVTGGYATFDNPGAEPVVIAAVRTAAARVVELHVMTERDSVMRMQRVEQFVVPARGRLVLAPAGAHLMIFGAVKPLAAGEHVTLTIVLKDGRQFDVRFEVRRRDA